VASSSQKPRTIVGWSCRCDLRSKRRITAKKKRSRCKAAEGESSRELVFILIDDLSLRYKAAEPVLKTRRADARVIARGEALIVQLYTEVERVDVCGHLPCVSGCA
jgi:hypothetical protein